MTEVEEWQDGHDKNKLQKRSAQSGSHDVTVVSCSDDGTVNVWHPLLVSTVCVCVVMK